MTDFIDLGSYLEEVKAFSRLAEPFVDKTSSVHLDTITDELARHIDTPRQDFTWNTRSAVLFKPSVNYDGPGRTFPPTHFKLSFNCAFSRSGKASKKCKVWNLAHSAVHIEIIQADVVPLKVHFDYKNAGQWGPQMHFQLHEDIAYFPIPRIATGAFLPTDCADLMLSELHPTEWKEEQHKLSSKHDVSVLRDGQEYRTLSYLRDIAKTWQSKDFTRFSTLQSYTSTVGALPTAANRPAKKLGW